MHRHQHRFPQLPSCPSPSSSLSTGKANVSEMQTIDTHAIVKFTLGHIYRGSVKYGSRKNVSVIKYNIKPTLFVYCVVPGHQHNSLIRCGGLFRILVLNHNNKLIDQKPINHRKWSFLHWIECSSS